MSNNKVLITICGPTASGKTTLADLFKNEGYKGIVTTTTRPSRTGEIDGINYYFTTPEQFSQMEKEGKLLESSIIKSNYYGCSKQGINDVFKANSFAVLVMEPVGANKVAEFCKEAGIINLKVYINNPLSILIERLQDRKDNDAKATELEYKDRLWNMVFVEPKEWTAKAYDGIDHYDHIFDTFGAHNEQDILKEIIYSVEKSLNSIHNTSSKPRL